MELGKALSLMQDAIYENAVQILTENQIPASLGRLVLDGVYRRFLESAYHAEIISSTDEKTPQEDIESAEEDTGKVVDTITDIEEAEKYAHT